jgi:hypothetical protein
LSGRWPLRDGAGLGSDVVQGSQIPPAAYRLRFISVDFQVLEIVAGSVIADPEAVKACGAGQR